MHTRRLLGRADLFWCSSHCRLLCVADSPDATAALFTRLMAAIQATRPPVLRDAYLLRTLTCRLARTSVAATRINLVVGNFIEASVVCQLSAERGEGASLFVGLCGQHKAPIADML
jgi:hypothetical protein